MSRQGSLSSVSRQSNDSSRLSSISNRSITEEEITERESLATTQILVSTMIYQICYVRNIFDRSFFEC